MRAGVAGRRLGPRVAGADDALLAGRPVPRAPHLRSSPPRGVSATSPHPRSARRKRRQSANVKGYEESLSWRAGRMRYALVARAQVRLSRSVRMGTFLIGTFLSDEETAWVAVSALAECRPEFSRAPPSIGPHKVQSGTRRLGGSRPVFELVMNCKCQPKRLSVMCLHAERTSAKPTGRSQDELLQDSDSRTYDNGETS